MIRLPIETMNRQRRGAVEWSAGKVRIEQGTLTDDELEQVRETLLDEHRLQSNDAGEDDEPEPDRMLKGPGDTPEAFMFHASFLAVGAGCLVMYEEASGDELDQVLFK